MYIGTWCEEAGAVHADGVYYPPSGGPAVPVPREPCDPITALLQELEVCKGKTPSLMPVAEDPDVAWGGGHAEEVGVAAAQGEP